MRSIRGIDAALRRIERRLGGEKKVFLPLIFGAEGETFEEILARVTKQAGLTMDQIGSAFVIWVDADGNDTRSQSWTAPGYGLSKAEREAHWQKVLKMTPEDSERLRRWANQRQQEAGQRALAIQQRLAMAGTTDDTAD